MNKLSLTHLLSRKSKGFTLIELLVVIAIIAILAVIVLVSVGGATNKGRDAAVKENLSSFVTNSEIINNNTTSYATVCTSGNTAGNAYDAAVAASGKTGKNGCWPLAGSYVACVEEAASAGNAWCVDSSGVKKEITAAQCKALTASSTVCP